MGKALSGKVEVGQRRRCSKDENAEKKGRTAGCFQLVNGAYDCNDLEHYGALRCNNYMFKYFLVPNMANPTRLGSTIYLSPTNIVLRCRRNC